jgi:hypothetical protein
MRFTAITLLALGASTSAYVVPQVQNNAVAARMVVSQLAFCSITYMV